MRIAALAVAVALLVTPLTAATNPAPAEAADLSPDFDLANYLAQSTELEGAVFDFRGLTTTGTSYKTSNLRFLVTETLNGKGIKDDNRSSINQTATSPAYERTETQTNTYTSTHTVNFGFEVSRSFGINVLFGDTETDFKMSFGYSFSEARTSTTTVTETVKASPQNLVIPPGHHGEIQEMFYRGVYSADVEVSGDVTGNVLITRCGTSMSVPIGELLSMQEKFGLPRLPPWITTDGTTVHITTTAQFTSKGGTTHVVLMTTEPLDKSQPPTTTTIGSMMPPLTPTSFEQPSKPKLKLYRQTNVAPLLDCKSKTFDGAVYLAPNGLLHSTVDGMPLPLPDGRAAITASGVRFSPGIMYASAIGDSGLAYWYDGNAFRALNLPTIAVQTADGGAILGDNGRVYDARNGALIAGPGGVEFSKVSASPVRNVGVFISAITADGRAYFYNAKGRLQPVSVPTPIVDTRDGVVLLGADGNAYNAADGSVIPMPGGARIAQVSAAHDYGHQIIYSAVDTNGNAYWSSQGKTFAKLDTGRVVSTHDGAVLVTADGRILDAWNGFTYGSGFTSPPSVSATWMPRSGTLISVVRSDNSVHYFEFDGWRTIE